MPTKHEARKNRLETRWAEATRLPAVAVSLSGPIGPFPVTAEAMLEKCIDLPGALERFRRASRGFLFDQGLCTRVIRSPAEVPPLSAGTWFNYSASCSGSLDDARMWMKRGREALAVVVEEENLVIGYGTALRDRRRKWTELMIVDVDRYSRRSAGLAAEVLLDGQRFEVGVAHVVVLELMNSIQGPLRADATNPGSRYVLKSLGFVHDQGNPNPCILTFE